MKLSLPAILQNNDRGLDAVPTATLRKCLKPILDGLKTIDAEELLGLEEDPAGEGPCLRKRLVANSLSHGRFSHLDIPNEIVSCSL